MCKIIECEDCGKEHISVEDHEACCWRVYVKSMFAGVMWGLVLSSIFIVRL